jgi:hypothetical protein
MAKPKVFISFDYDHDDDLKVMLVGQSKLGDSPFELADWSIKEAIDDNWKAHARKRIKAVDVVIVICGEYTHTAAGVSAEVTLAQDEGVRYYLLQGRANKTCTKPKAAKSGDAMYQWTWENLKKLIGK